MPSIYADGFEIRVIPGDHEPAHVHVKKGGAEIVILISKGSIEVRENRGMKRPAAKQALEAVSSVYDQLQEMWKASQPKNA